METLLIIAGALAGGFVNGLTGFGTAITAMPFWLFVLPGALASQLAAASGVLAQLQTLPQIWRTIRWRFVLPFVGPGLLGVPVGAWLAPMLPDAAFKAAVGVILMGYSGVMLADGTRLRMARSGRVGDMLIGLGGGIIGGIAGLSGVLPTVWASIQGFGKDDKRALFQTFNVSVLATMLAANALAGRLGLQLAWLLLLSLPATMVGALLGSRLYARLDARRYDRVVLWLLFSLGSTLVVARLFQP
jgi:uncharacterized membrane protein YfcA